MHQLSKIQPENISEVLTIGLMFLIEKLLKARKKNIVNRIHSLLRSESEINSLFHIYKYLIPTLTNLFNNLKCKS